MFDGSEAIPMPNKNEIRLEKSMTLIPNNYGLVFPICQFQQSASPFLGQRDSNIFQVWNFKLGNFSSRLPAMVLSASRRILRKSSTTGLQKGRRVSNAQEHFCLLNLPSFIISELPFSFVNTWKILERNLQEISFKIFKWKPSWVKSDLQFLLCQTLLSLRPSDNVPYFVRHKSGCHLEEDPPFLSLGTPIQSVKHR